MTWTDDDYQPAASATGRLNMTSSPFGLKSKLAGPGATLTISPANSPLLKSPARSPSKTSSLQSTLSLHTVIGTTTSSPNGFDYHSKSRSFALCAGSAVILGEFDDSLSLSQRFFRARPTALAVNPSQSFYNPSTTSVTPESRRRTLGPLRGGLQNAIHTGSPGRDWNEGGASRVLTSKERIKAATSVSLSEDGRLLAVGETGYSPRVLIFSTARDGPCDVPLSILTEHSFGVRSLAFSQDSQYLATLGEVNDGFLLIWTINQRNGSAKLHSTNKCTSFIRNMAWVGDRLVTVGTRHVKVWRAGELGNSSPTKLNRFALEGDFVPSPGPRALAGRNCLLGPLVEATFTCVAAISDHCAVICTDKGQVCVLDDQDGRQELRHIKTIRCPITSVTADRESGRVWLGGAHQHVQMLRIEDIVAASSVPGVSHSHPQTPLTSSPSPGSPSGSSTPNSLLIDSSNGNGTVIAIGLVAGQLITLDSNRTIKICEAGLIDDHVPQASSEVLVSAHRDAVHGVGPITRPNLFDADFFTWSSGGNVGFWTLLGTRLKSTSVELEQLLNGEDEIPNELKILRASHDNEFFISGDKYGVVRLIESKSWTTINEIRAHGAEITDIALHANNGSLYVASCGRDRMVQLFQKTSRSLDLVQTMDDHVGAVGHVLFVNDGERLVSSSADRTVVVRDRLSRAVSADSTIVYLMSRVITLKASPVSMALIPDDPDTLAISTIDRHVMTYNLTSGSQVNSFRASDPDSNENVVMSSLSISKDGFANASKILVGVSTTDKSIRVYDYERATLLTREFGHTEGVSDVALIDQASPNSNNRPKRTLVSTGLDGIIMIWDLSLQSSTPLQELSQPRTRSGDDSTPAKELTVMKTPLRRILSRSELAEFQRPTASSGTTVPKREQSPPRLRKKTSRITFGSQTMRASTVASPAPIPNFQPPAQQQRSPTSILPPRDRSPSPPSPRTPGRQRTFRRPSLADLRSRTKSANNVSEFGSLDFSTDQVCRTLRTYRKKLASASSTDGPLIGAAELEKELLLTARMLGKRMPQRHTTESENDPSLAALSRKMSEIGIGEETTNNNDGEGALGLGIGGPSGTTDGVDELKKVGVKQPAENGTVVEAAGKG